MSDTTYVQDDPPVALPCPFCGGPATICVTRGGHEVDHDPVYKVMCRFKCCAETIWDTEESVVLARWNTRAVLATRENIERDSYIAALVTILTKHTIVEAKEEARRTLERWSAENGARKLIFNEGE